MALCLVLLQYVAVCIYLNLPVPFQSFHARAKLVGWYSQAHVNRFTKQPLTKSDKFFHSPEHTSYHAAGRSSNMP